jgi:hypothetical protein
MSGSYAKSKKCPAAMLSAGGRRSAIFGFRRRTRPFGSTNLILIFRQSEIWTDLPPPRVGKVLKAEVRSAQPAVITGRR